MATPPPPPPPPPDARAFVATTAVASAAQSPYEMDVPIRLVFETLPRFIFVFPLQFLSRACSCPRGSCMKQKAIDQRRRRPPRAPVRARYATGSTERRGSTSSTLADATPAAPTLRDPTG